MPSSTVTFALYQANVTPWLLVTDGTIKFDSLTEDPTYHYFGSPKYYAVECTKSGGDEPTGSTRKIQMAYSNETIPTGQATGKGLGVKCVRTALRATTTGEDATPLSKTNLGTTSSVLLTAVNGGWLRIYVGIYTGSPTVTGCEIFSALDVQGAYSGQLTVSLLSV
jgi:hypothetical protein